MRPLLIALCLFLSACESVQPWERGSLAREDMQWDTDRMDSALRKQTQYSKEAATGGGGAAGGGCGCN